MSSAKQKWQWSTVNPIPMHFNYLNMYDINTYDNFSFKKPRHTIWIVYVNSHSMMSVHVASYCKQFTMLTGQQLTSSIIPMNPFKSTDL